MREFEFGVPTPDDLAAVADRFLPYGPGAARKILDCTNALDFQVVSLDNKPVAPPPPKPIDTLSQGDSVETGTKDSAIDSLPPRETFDVEVVYRCVQPLGFPVGLRVRFYDGSVRDTVVAGEVGMFTWKLTGVTPAQSAEIDPEHIYAVDMNYLNSLADPRRIPRGRAAALLRLGVSGRVALQRTVGVMMNGVVRSGWRGWRGNSRLWTGLYLAKLLLAVIVTIPVMSLINSSVDNSLYAVPLVTEWSLDVIGELLLTRPNLAPVFFVSLAFFALLVFFLKQFINGGIYVSLYRGQLLSARSFFGESGAQFGGNLKISAIMLAVYAGLTLVAFLVVPIIPRSFGREFQTGVLVGLTARMALVWAIFIVGGILSDLLRLNLAARPDLPLKQHWRNAVALYRRRFVELNGLYYLYFLPFVVVWLLIEKLAVIVTGGFSSVGGVMLEIVLFQICSWLRTGQSLLFTSTAGVVVRRELLSRLEKQGDDSR